MAHDTLKPSPQGAETWTVDSVTPVAVGRLPKDAHVELPKRHLSVGEIDLYIAPADAPVEVTKGPEGVTAKVDKMPSSRDIIVPYLKVTTHGERYQTPVLIGGEGKAIIIVGPGVQANADRPGRTRGNTILHPLPGAAIKSPKPQAA